MWYYLITDSHEQRSSLNFAPKSMLERDNINFIENRPNPVVYL